MSSLSDRPLSSYFGSSVVLFALILPLIMADQQKKMFSLEKAVAGNKRALETPEKVRKIPKVSQMTPTEPRPQRVTTNGPVVMCVYPVTDSAGDLWAQYKDTDEKLWQVQVDHDARLLLKINLATPFLTPFPPLPPHMTPTMSQGVSEFANIQDLQFQSTFAAPLRNT